MTELHEMLLIVSMEPIEFDAQPAAQRFNVHSITDSLSEFERVLPKILAERTNPPVVNADTACIVRVRAERGRLLTFYEGSLLALAGDKEGWRQAMNAVLRGEPDNPYYNWVLERR